MRRALPLKSGLLTGLLLLSSCATTHYSDDTSKNNYSNLQSGRVYSFSMKDGSKKEKMVFSRLKGDSLIGYKSKKDSTVVKLPKKNVASATDTKKSTVVIGSVAIGVAGAAVIGVSASRSTK